MKKIISTILCLALAASLCVGFAFAAGLSNFTRKNTYQNGMFSDVGAKSWFNGNVKDAYELGLMQGKGAGLFGANDNITLAETVALAARIHSIYNTGKDSFVQGTPWYAVYYDYAVENKLITTQQYRDYDTAASRFEFVSILYYSLPLSEFGTINVIDYNAIPDVTQSSAEYIYTFYRAGILTGKDDRGSFLPQEKILRCEAAAVVSRMVFPQQRIKFTLNIDTNEAAGTLQTAYDAMSEANRSFRLAYLAYSMGSAGYVNYLTQSAALTQSAYSHLERVCADLKGTAAYEGANAAYVMCPDIYKGIQYVAASPNTNGWNVVYGYFNTALAYIESAMSVA